MSVSILSKATDFAEDKDVAAEIRDKILRPALGARREIVLNFTGVELATRSFIHAMISDILRSHGEKALDLLVFKGCQPGVRGIIETVIQYSLETMDEGRFAETNRPGS